MSESAKSRWEQFFKAGQLFVHQQSLAQADEAIRGSLDAANETADPTLLAQSWALLAQLRMQQGQRDAADTAMERAADAAARAPEGTEDAGFALMLNNLARMYFKRTAHARAEPLLRRLLAIKQRTSSNQLEVAAVYANLGKLLHGRRKFDEAEECWRFALAIRERGLPANDLALAAALEGLADACEAQRKSGQAKSMRERAVAIRGEVLGPEHAQANDGASHRDGPTPSLSLEQMLYVPPGVARSPSGSGLPFFDSAPRARPAGRRARKGGRGWRRVKLAAFLILVAAGIFGGWTLHARYVNHVHLVWILAKALVSDAPDDPARPRSHRATFGERLRFPAAQAAPVIDSVRRAGRMRADSASGAASTATSLR